MYFQYKNNSTGSVIGGLEMILQDVPAQIMYYNLGAIEVLTIKINDDRIEYTSWGREGESSHESYFIHYRDDQNFSLDNKPIVDLSCIDVTEQNEDQWFQLMCVTDFGTVDPYVLRAAQKYCKRVTRVLQTVYGPDYYHPITLQVLRHT